MHHGERRGLQQVSAGPVLVRDSRDARSQSPVPPSLPSGYGDYIIGMEDYLEAYFDAVEQDKEYSCKYKKDYGDCICDNENTDE